MIINVVVEGAERTRAALGATPNRVMLAIYYAVAAQVMELHRLVVAEKLTGEVLNVRTGNLRRSIQMRLSMEGDAIVGEVFSNGTVPYAAIHEFGGDIFPKTAKALSFMVNGRRVFTQHVHMPERSYLRSSLRERSQPFIDAVKAAVGQALKSEVTA